MNRWPTDVGKRVYEGSVLALSGFIWILVLKEVTWRIITGVSNRQFSENICSEDDLRSTIISWDCKVLMILAVCGLYFVWDFRDFFHVY